jgi:hypothetical protein|tara:strand:- start:654 stop:974 length:321 start_codon:yes stop_codon:yes gene_type:complete
MGKKSTNLEIQERVNTIYQLLIKSWSRFDILQYAATEWNLSSRQTDEYLARARKLIEEDSAIERPQWLAAAVRRLAEYEKRAGRDDQVQTAIKALETQAKLLRFDI